MRVGIYTRYQRADDTIASMGLAALLRGAGHDVRVRVRGWRTNAVDADWDADAEGGVRTFHPKDGPHKAAALRRESRAFRDWAGTRDVVIWTAAPDEGEAYRLRTHARKRQLLWCGWDRLVPGDEWAVNAVDRVLAPSPHQADAVGRRFGRTDAAAASYWPRLPTTFKAPDYSCPVRVLLPLYGSQLKRVEWPAVNAVIQAAAAHAHVRVVVACSGGLKGSVRDHIRRRARGDLAGRLGVLYDCPWSDLVMLAGQASLVADPATSGGFGVLAANATAMGTPVLAFRIPPATEYLTDGVSAVLVDTQWSVNWAGAPRSHPDYGSYAAALDALVRDRDRLALLALGASNRRLLEEGRAAAEWDKALAG